MSNEALVALIQSGDRDKLLELWDQTRRLVWTQARRWAGRGGTDIEDLVQSGFVALLRAVDTFDPTRAKFSTYLFPFLQTEFSIATGQRLKRTALDPLHTALSLDAPLSDDDEAGTLADVISDPVAEEALAAVDEQDWNRHLHDDLETALATLSEEERRVIIAHFYQGKTMGRIATDEGVSKAAVCRREQKGMMRLRHPSHSNVLRVYL